MGRPPARASLPSRGWSSPPRNQCCTCQTTVSTRTVSIGALPVCRMVWHCAYGHCIDRGTLVWHCAYGHFIEWYGMMPKAKSSCSAPSLKQSQLRTRGCTSGCSYSGWPFVEFNPFMNRIPSHPKRIHRDLLPTGTAPYYHCSRFAINSFVKDCDEGARHVLHINEVSAAAGRQRGDRGWWLRVELPVMLEP